MDFSAVFIAPLFAAVIILLWKAGNWILDRGGCSFVGYTLASRCCSFYNPKNHLPSFVRKTTKKFCISFFLIRKELQKLKSDENTKGFDPFHHYKKILFHMGIIVLLDKIAYPKARLGHSMILKALLFALLAPLPLLVLFSPHPPDPKQLLTGLMIIPLVQLVLDSNHEISVAFLEIFGKDDMVREINSSDSGKANTDCPVVASRNPWKKPTLLPQPSDTFVAKKRDLFMKAIQSSNAFAPRLWNRFCLEEKRKRLEKDADQAVNLRYALVKYNYPVSASVSLSIFIVFGILFIFIGLPLVAFYFLLAALSMTIFSLWLNVRSLVKMYFLGRFSEHFLALVDEINENVHSNRTMIEEIIDHSIP